MGGDYDPVDAIKVGTYGGLLGGGAGLFVAAIRNAMSKQNVGAFGLFRRGGFLITGMAGTGGALMFTSAVTANLRGVRDWKSEATGGFAAGAVQGLIAKSIPKVFGFGTAFAVIMGLGEYTGGIIGHNRVNSNPDEYEDKERMRRSRRRPIEETLANIGEGRGIQPPGYEERRIQRLKERYGVEVKTVSAVARDG